MAGTRISTTVTDTVLLGSAIYPSDLFVTPTGFIDPATRGGPGVISTQNNVRLANEGQITGGAGSTDGGGGGIGVDISYGGTIANTGTITGGSANTDLPPGYTAGPGGDGVFIVSGKIGNTGEIVGGAGGYSSTNKVLDAASNGGNGVYLDSSSLFNSGTIIGGIGGGSLGNPGTGVVVAGSGSTLRNTGQITGGSQRVHSFSYTEGGIGVSVSNADTLVNLGTITGGSGPFDFNGFDGGTGVDIEAGGLAINHGAIYGGPGQAPGVGGIGVYINGGTLVDYGNISYGPSYLPPYDYFFYPNAAVQFGPEGGTLVLEPGVGRIIGGVYADANNTTLRLAGTGGAIDENHGTADIFATFSNVIVNLDASWTVTNEVLHTGATLRDLGKLTITENLTVSRPNAAVFIGPEATLSILGNLGVDAVHFAPGGGTLSIGPKATFNGNQADPAAISTLTNFGAGDVIHLAQIATSLSLSGGTLTLDNGTTVLKTLTLAGDYTTENFHLAHDKGGGTDIIYVPTPTAHTAETHPESSTGLMAWFHTHIT